MSFQYSFVSLDEAQLQRRRHLLDTYGQIAQLSALIPLLAWQLPLLVQSVRNRLTLSQKSDRTKAHASPVVSRFANDAGKTNGRRVTRWARFKWFLDGEVAQGWGTWRVVLIAALWATWLSILAIRNTGDDYLHLTKRFGIIGASQLPLHYLLAVKSSWSPVTLLTGLSHEELNSYHRALGRIVLLFFSLHASFYLNFFIQKSLLVKRIQDRDVILGLLAITSFLILGTTALAWVRRKNYFLFFVIHVAISLSVLPILYFHVSHLRVYILESTFVYLILILQRNYSQTAIPNATISHIQGFTNLISITIPLPPSLSKTSKQTFHPGQHIYLALPNTSLTAPHEKLRLNPFTIANLPHQDNDADNNNNSIQLVLRSLSGTTSLLSSLAPNKGSPQKTATAPLLIEGPYGSASSFFPSLPSSDRILLVAGGVGATFTLPIYRALLARNFPPANIHFVWSTRRFGDTQWSWQYLNRRPEASNIKFYITGARILKGHLPGHFDEDPEAREEAERTGLLPEEDEYDARAPDAPDVVVGVDGSQAVSPPRIGVDPPSVPLLPGRPDFAGVAREFFSLGAVGGEREGLALVKAAVLVCGPAGMAAGLRREVGRYVRSGKADVWWHDEQFGW
ncbi:MAG: hypothetical protein LQ352_006162 [Teloschistes flavicans]|nr:MAG: hypothetical protein LQ352_006162 [Teloschistes flavicans]